MTCRSRSVTACAPGPTPTPTTATQSATDPTQLTPEGKGAIYEREFVGTGFYVGGQFILTNRHVAQPWLADEGILSLNTTVQAQPRLKKIMAFFPDVPQPDRSILERARTGATIVLTDDPSEAARGADVVNTDVWASMGQEAVKLGIGLHAEGRGGVEVRESDVVGGEGEVLPRSAVRVGGRHQHVRLVEATTLQPPGCLGEQPTTRGLRD